MAESPAYVFSDEKLASAFFFLEGEICEVANAAVAAEIVSRDLFIRPGRDDEDRIKKAMADLDRCRVFVVDAEDADAFFYLINQVDVAARALKKAWYRGFENGRTAA